MAYDLVALGETMFTLQPPAGETLREAAALRVDHAGAESNTCVGLARLGFDVAWVSRLGADPAGERILEWLSAEGVDTRFVRRDPEHATGVMLKDPTANRVHYYRTHSAASRLAPEDLHDVPVTEAKAVLVTGVTALIGEAPQAAAVAMLSEARGLRVVDPNLRKGLWGSARRAELVLPLVERCDLLFGGEQELAEIVGAAHGPEALARRCAERGPHEVVVRSAESVGVLEKRGAFHVFDARRQDAVDPIGAGDAFNAGYLAVRLRGGSVEEAFRAGAYCGRCVALDLGDTRGFPRTLTP